MGDRHELRDDQWERIKSYFEGATRRGRPPKQALIVINAILWILATGAPWRDLPEKFGPWSTIYGRWVKWVNDGLWNRIYGELTESPDVESFMIDATIVRAHQDASGAQKKHGPQGIGRSRGGPSTKIHAVVDALGNPVRLHLTDGQTHDVRCAAPLLEGLATANIIADKGYDSDAVIAQIVAQKCVPVIPSKRNRIAPRALDRDIYRERHLVENFFQKIRRYRRIAMRFEKLQKRFFAMVQLASIMVWLL